MKVIRAIFWIIIAIVAGAVAGLVIGAIALAAGALILRDALRKPLVRSTSGKS